MRILLVSVCLGLLAAAPASAQRTSVANDFPIYNIVRVTINSAGIFDEGANRHPDVAQVRVVIPKPRNKVAP